MPRKHMSERMLDVLGDGKAHRLGELMAVLEDDYASRGSVHFHLTLLRRRLAPTGLTVLYVPQGRGKFYRLVRLLDRAAVDKILTVSITNTSLTA